MTKPSGRQPARTRKTSGPRTGPKTSRAAQRAGTREQIRIAAFEHFSTIGFDETTTQAIAQRAGVAAGTVFLHPSDTAGLLFLVLHDRRVSDAQARGEVASDLNPTACAQNIFGLYFMTLLGWLSGHYTLETALDPMLRSSLELQIRGFRPSQ